MRVTPPDIARLALPLLIAAVFCTACGANRPTEPFFFPTVTPPTATPTSIRTATTAPAATATTALAAATPMPLSPPCATQPPDARCMSVNATLAARPTPPPLSDYTLTLTAEPLTGASYTYWFRARLVGPEHPLCVGESWDFGDGVPQPIRTPACAAYEPPATTTAVPVTRDYDKGYAYRQSGTYRVQFCLLATGSRKLCATTTVQVR